MFEASKHIDLVVKCMKNLNNEEVDMFLKDLLNLNDTELVMMKKINEMSKDKKEEKTEKILYKNALSESIVEMKEEEAKPKLHFWEELANEVKKNPKKYTYKELAEKFGKNEHNIKVVASKYNLTDYVSRYPNYIAKENGNIDNEDVRAEILGFIDKK